MRKTGPNGRTAQDGNTNYMYNTAGCLATIDTHTKRTHFGYNVDGQLVRAELPDARVAEYTYDALGRRCRRKIGKRVTEYLWNGCVLFGEVEGKGKDRIFITHGYDLLAEWESETRLFPVLDTSGAVREVLDDRGSLIWDCGLEAYGAVYAETGRIADRHRMRGQYSDQLTGLYDNFHRTYHPGLGSYMSPDPLGPVGEGDYYGYPRNPLRWNDPLGLNCNPEHETDPEKEAGKPFALGLHDSLDAFAEDRGATTWKDFDDPTQWKAGVIDKLNDPNTPVHFNLDGVDVWAGVSRAAGGRGGATDWELLQVRQNPQSWDTLQFWKGGQPVDNPFK